METRCLHMLCCVKLGGKNCGSRCLKHPAGVFDHWYFHRLRFCMFGMYLLCQYHSELDGVRFWSEIGDEVKLKWCGGLVAAVALMTTGCPPGPWARKICKQDWWTCVPWCFARKLSNITYKTMIVLMQRPQYDYENSDHKERTKLKWNRWLLATSVPRWLTVYDLHWLPWLSVLCFTETVRWLFWLGVWGYYGNTVKKLTNICMYIYIYMYIELYWLGPQKW